jgi:hypothetical protein
VAEQTRPEGWFARPIGPSGTVEEVSRVAGRLAAPSEGSTGSGLPVRTPRAHLVPGAFEEGAPAAAPKRSAEEVRDRLRGFQSGVERGRAPE